MQPNLKLPPVRIRSVSKVHIDPFKLVGPSVAFLFGFFLQFNILTSTFGLPFQRITDALLFLFVPCLFVVVGIGRTVRDGLLYFVVLFGIVGATLMLKTAVASGDIYLTLIFLLTSVFSFYFVCVAENESILVYFAVGTVLGLIPSLAVLFIQANGNTGLTALGLAVPTEELTPLQLLFTRTKWGGIWTAGNESGHVYAVATASALYLALRFRKPLIYVAAYGLLVASFSLTLNRAGLIAPTIGLIYCYVRLGDSLLYLKSVLMVVAAVAILTTTPGLPGLDVLYDSIETRFVDDSQADANVAERLMSNIEGVKVAMENPFGIGYEERTAIMVLRTTNGVISIHNGFLSLAYQSGLLVSLLYIASCIYLLARRRQVSSFYVIMMLFTVTSMFFEELSINQFFIFSVALTTAAAWLHVVKGRNLSAARSMNGLRRKRQFQRFAR